MVRAIDLWCKKLGQEDIPENEEHEDDGVDDDVDQERPEGPPPQGPHPEWLCEMCKMLRKPCWEKKTLRNSRNKMYANLVGHT